MWNIHQKHEDKNSRSSAQDKSQNIKKKTVVAQEQKKSKTSTVTESVHKQTSNQPVSSFKNRNFRDSLITGKSTSIVSGSLPPSFSSGKSRITAGQQLDANRQIPTKQLSPTFQNDKKKNSTKEMNSNKPKKSSSIIKTKYFPSKNMISNVVKEQKREGTNSKDSSNQKFKKSLEGLHEDKVQSITIDRKSKTIDNKERTRTRTLSSSEIKIAQRMEMSNEIHEIQDVQSLERPKTATLKKGLIVNSNIVGPDTPLTIKASSSNISQDQQDQYEDDFESYESDFERYSSSSSTSSLLDAEQIIYSTNINDKEENSFKADNEERKLDSGNFDLTEIKYKHSLTDVRESHENEGMFKGDLALCISLSDEGFEDGRSYSKDKVQFYNFVGAQKKQVQQEILRKKQQRGEEILSMIKLNKWYFTLFEIFSMTYEKFITMYGKTNSFQILIQTTKTDICESLQTDQIVHQNKWVQIPVTFPAFRSSEDFDIQTYKENYLGVGSDTKENNSNKSLDKIKYNENHLQKFIKLSSQIILSILNRTSNKMDEQIKTSNEGVPFGTNSFKVNTKLFTVLNDTSLSYLCVSKSNSSEFLTIHTAVDVTTKRSIICVWNLICLENPYKILTTTGYLSCADFGFDDSNFIFGGSSDGLLRIWNWNNLYHPSYERLTVNINNVNALLPSYTSNICLNHEAKIVSVCSLPDTAWYILTLKSMNVNTSKKICSLDEEGVLIVWGVMITVKKEHFNSFKEILSVVPYTKIVLNKIHSNLPNLECKELHFNTLDPKHFYIITNYGYIIHCLETGSRSYPKKYTLGDISSTTTMDICPFSELYFVVGYENGKIALFARNIRKPLMILLNNGNVNHGSIDILQWSTEKPCIFYVKDSKNLLHIWNLVFSDIFPVYSIPFKQDIVSIKLSSFKKATYPLKSYMVMATEDGQLWIIFFNNEHESQTEEEYRSDIRYFLNYVNRL